MNDFDKDRLTPYFERWESMRDEIKAYYDQNDRQAVNLMTRAIDNYDRLLQQGGKEPDGTTDRFLPLNGEERFEFIKEKIASHYAFVQLDALYMETKKKAARLSVQRR